MAWTLFGWLIWSYGISTIVVNCLNFWDEAWWFLSLRVFGLLSSSLLLFPRFGEYVLWPSSGVCLTNTWGRPVFVRQTPEEGQRIYRPKRCGNNDKDEDNSLKTLNDNKHCWLSNVKSCFYICIRYMICKHILLIHTVKRSNSSISNNSV